MSYAAFILTSFVSMHGMPGPRCKMQLNKNDQNDAEGLAQIMRTGWYRSVHV
ncbi:protein of unknown function [Hyphomicrobium sp. 1Nfss2.1]|uniref:hypothetical protein n=1 Tax=Hyphomicrobium sp. 1Nfss2.1 TaxID=3413936 RepID=UPI003C7E9A80